MATNETLKLLAEKHNAEFTSTFGEPGYTQPRAGVVLADWNDVDKDHSDKLEAEGYDLVWSDEWTIVDDKAYRTCADSYHWQSSILFCDGEYTTLEHPTYWIENCEIKLGHGGITPLPAHFPEDEILKAGYVLAESGLESGWFSGQDADPAACAAAHFAAGAEYVLFQRTEQSQFYTTWRVWTKPAEEDTE